MPLEVYQTPMNLARDLNEYKRNLYDRFECINCGAKTIFETTSDVVELENSLIIIRNTPCHKCTECNEIMYTGE
jgi:YgiT-type zinc finger domain-containing protein